MQTIASEEMRQSWGTTLDRVFKGDTLAVQRFGRPMVVLVGYDAWKSIEDELAKLRRIVQADQHFADMRQGNYSEG